MILMGNRCSEDRHNAVSECLIYRAFELMHSVHHDVNGGIEELLGSFWIKIFNQLRRVLDVSKADGDLFAFSFEGTAGGEDFFGQVLGRVGERWFLFLGTGRIGC
jgi:hypothetical protein